MNELSWLTAGLGLVRTTPPLDVKTAAPLLAATLDELGALPPSGVVVDLATLFLGGRIDPRSPLVADPTLAAAVARYEHQLLGRVAADRRLEPLRDAIHRLPAQLRVIAIGITVAALVGRTGAKGRDVPAAIVRRLGDGDPFTALRDDPAVRAELAASYDGLVAASQRTRALITDGDVFTIEHLEALEGLGQRVALADVLAAEAALLERIPRRIARRPRPRGATSTRIEAEDSYPVGGFSSISNSGSFENLVTSELVYLEEGDEIDLFDVRFAQGELLFYMRDEATFVRPRRRLSFVFGPELVEARCKDPELPWQRSIALLAMVHACVTRLVEELGHEDLQVRIVAPPVLAAEGALAEILFREAIERGVVEVCLEPSREIEEAEAFATRGLSQIVWCGAGGAARSRGAFEQHEIVVGRRDCAALAATLHDLLRLLP